MVNFIRKCMCNAVPNNSRLVHKGGILELVGLRQDLDFGSALPQHGYAIVACFERDGQRNRQQLRFASVPNWGLIRPNLHTGVCVLVWVLEFAG